MSESCKSCIHYDACADADVLNVYGDCPTFSDKSEWTHLPLKDSNIGVCPNLDGNYAVINGKRIELADEQAKALGIKRKNPFERVADGDPYYYIATDSYIHSVHENYDQCNYDAYYSVNYFNDKDFANQVALHQLLYRKLLKFTYDNNCEDTAEWNGGNPHCYITYATDIADFVVGEDFVFKAHGIYFASEEAAERAINEVVKPFVKEHPDFVW
uniref:Uncharacterized protein n=1 Tax=Myoviridae sp. ctj3P51 TaxID=2826687 RepID=A0A8S5NP49_9CAUD|nr:MAG TPA: hypothetical protein [Myoviridae sp. ctj3P51]